MRLEARGERCYIGRRGTRALGAPGDTARDEGIRRALEGTRRGHEEVVGLGNDEGTTRRGCQTILHQLLIRLLIN